jgi:hypothetical protein
VRLDRGSEAQYGPRPGDRLLPGGLGFAWLVVFKALA